MATSAKTATFLPLAKLPRTPASDLKRLGWRGMNVLRSKGKLLVTNHGEPEAVIIPVEEYDALMHIVEQSEAQAESAPAGLRRSFDERLAVLQDRSAAARLKSTIRGRATAKIMEATKTHDVLIWFCGLSSPEPHMARVNARVAAGGHPIPEEKIRERYPLAQLNLIKLMPHVAYIQVYDNSTEAAADGTVPDPLLMLEMENGRVMSPGPDDLEALQSAPEWTKSVLEAAATHWADTQMKIAVRAMKDLCRTRARRFKAGFGTLKAKSRWKEGWKRVVRRSEHFGAPQEVENALRTPRMSSSDYRLNRLVASRNCCRTDG